MSDTLIQASCEASRKLDEAVTAVLACNRFRWRRRRLGMIGKSYGHVVRRFAVGLSSILECLRRNLPLAGVRNRHEPRWVYPPPKPSIGSDPGVVRLRSRVRQDLRLLDKVALTLLWRSPNIRKAPLHPSSCGFDRRSKLKRTPRPLKSRSPNHANACATPIGNPPKL